MCVLHMYIHQIIRETLLINRNIFIKNVSLKKKCFSKIKAYSSTINGKYYKRYFVLNELNVTFRVPWKYFKCTYLPKMI